MGSLDPAGFRRVAGQEPATLVAELVFLGVVQGVGVAPVAVEGVVAGGGAGAHHFEDAAVDFQRGITDKGVCGGGEERARPS